MSNTWGGAIPSVLPSVKVNKQIIIKLPYFTSLKPITKTIIS